MRLYRYIRTVTAMGVRGYNSLRHACIGEYEWNIMPHIAGKDHTCPDDCKYKLQ